MRFLKGLYCTALPSSDDRQVEKKILYSSKAFVALLTELLKAFDCICHDLLVAKLRAYGLSLPALKMIQDYLLNRKQRTKIGSSYSTWENIKSGVPQALF